MNIELYLILSAAYEYTREPMSQEDEEALMHRRYIRNGIETYFHKHGYVYDRDKKEWLDETSTVGTLFTEEQKLEVGRMLLEGVSIESIQEVVRSWGVEVREQRTAGKYDVQNSRGSNPA